MSIHTGEPATLSQLEAIRLQTENREWSKELRRCMTALVNTRMAHQISHEEYSTSRRAAKDERAECDRRTAILNMELMRLDR
jgi:hypothetical protein